MKVLLTASVLSHIAQFHKPLIGLLKEQGHEVHVAAYDNLAVKDGLSLDHVDRLHNIHFHRSPFTPKNIPAYRQLCRVIDEGAYDIIHCNTPAVGVLTRLAARRARKKHGTKVFYTAHGFHFFKGAPLINWLLYYPTEKFMCRYTDTLITINEEDTRLVQERFRVHHFHMHGVGADSSRFLPVSAEEKQHLREQLGLQQEDRIILCAGELIPRKNMTTLIRVAEQLAPLVTHLRILIAGNGPMEPKLRALIRKLKLEGTVCLLGYRRNLQQYMQAADVVVSCSHQEGLGLNLVEGMLCGKPVVASDNRGHREFVQDEVSGFLVPPTDAASYTERIMQLLSDSPLYDRMAQAAMTDASLFAVHRTLPELRSLYSMLPHQQTSSEQKKKRMRVLILMSRDFGLYRFRKELLLELLHPGSYLPERMGEPSCELYIALPKGPFIPEFEKMGCNFIEVSIERHGTNPLKDIKLFNAYRRILATTKPDAVLTYTIKPNVYGGMACRLMGIPYFPNVTGLGVSIQNPGMLRVMALLLYRAGLGGARCVFFQNRANMDFMYLRRVRGKDARLLPGSGVDLPSHPFAEYPTEEQGVRFLSLIRIMEDKGIAELLACAERVKKTHPNVTFTLAGRFEGEHYRDAVENAHRMGWIDYLGFRDDTHELMKQHHCIIHPSYHEGLSNVLLETAACGRPVIASNVPGCVETFDEGISGLGFEVRNVESLIACVEKFLHLPHAQKEHMGKAARKKVEAEFDRKTVVRAYIEQLNKIQQIA